jgi:N-acyl-D-aspartate/D-glutamate deacylase
MDEADLLHIIRHPATMIASDGTVTVFGSAAPHPQLWHVCARARGLCAGEKYHARRRRAQDAVVPGSALGLTDRGAEAGMKADIMVFDPATVRDMVTFEKPHQYAAGVPHVIVKASAFTRTAMTAARPGRVSAAGKGRLANASCAPTAARGTRSAYAPLLHQRLHA